MYASLFQAPEAAKVNIFHVASRFFTADVDIIPDGDECQAFPLGTIVGRSMNITSHDDNKTRTKKGGREVSSGQKLVAFRKSHSISSPSFHRRHRHQQSSAASRRINITRELGLWLVSNINVDLLFSWLRQML